MQKAQPNEGSKLAQPRVIAITSGKGGVGKSSISVNIGISLAKAGAKVCLLDADTGLANANILLGLSPEFSLEHVLYGAKSIEEIMLDGPYGLKIIPGANGISECVSLHPRQQMRLTRELARIEDDFDYLLIDTAAGIADTTLDFIGASHHVVVVITPEPTSLTDAFSLIKLIHRRRTDIHYHVIVNMSSSINQAKEVFNRFRAAVEKYIGVQSQYLGFLLRDESMRAAVELQNPVAMFPDNDPSCRSFIKLADDLNAATVDTDTSGSFSTYWHQQFREHRSLGADRNKRAPVGKASTSNTTENRDSDYLSELRSRLLLLIEQGNASSEEIADLIQEGVRSFVGRHKRSPVDILELVELQLSSPNRDEALLANIANRVKPWVELQASPPTLELSGNVALEAGKELPQSPVPILSSEPTLENKQAGGISNESSPVSAPVIDASINKNAVDQKTSTEESFSENGPNGESTTATVVSASSSAANELATKDVTDNCENKVSGGREKADAVNSQVAAASARVHSYDNSRFGSQEHLLELLERSRQSEKTVKDVLDSLVEQG